MSAWLVSHAHVSALVTAGRRFALLPFPCDLDQIGRMLFAENMRSLRARYCERAAEYWPDGGKLAQTYTFRPVQVDAVALIKACNCFDYQACETGESYYATEAGRLVEAIRAATCLATGLDLARVEKSPAYAAAPWGLDDEEEAA